MAAAFGQPVEVSQDDVVHAFLYAQDFYFRYGTDVISIIDRILTLDSGLSMAKNLLLTGVKNVMDVGLASRGAFVMHGTELDVYVGRSLTTTPHAIRFTSQTLVEETKKIAKMNVSAICVHMDALWSFDVRWMMISPVLTYTLQAATGQKVEIGRSSMLVADVMTLVENAGVRASGIFWNWRKSKLRLHFLYGTSMTDEPYPSVAASLEDFEYFLLSGESVALTWYFSTRALVLGRSSFYMEYCSGIDNATDICNSLAPFLDGLVEVHALICQDHNGKQILIGDFARTEAEINLIATNDKRTLLQRLTWSPAEHPTFLLTVLKPLTKVSTISLALSEDFESGLYHHLFRQTILPVISKLTATAVSMDYKGKRFHLRLHAETDEMLYLDEILDGGLLQAAARTDIGKKARLSGKSPQHRQTFSLPTPLFLVR
jgi:hypothetical protein